MINKITEKKLKDALNQIDPAKLSKIKQSLENDRDLSAMLGRLDVQKAQQKLNELNIGDSVSANNLSDMVNTLKNNPELIHQLKKNL